jgi:hypothetical protein
MPVDESDAAPDSPDEVLEVALAIAAAHLGVAPEMLDDAADIVRQVYQLLTELAEFRAAEAPAPVDDPSG